MLLRHIVWMQFKPEVTAQNILEHKRAVLSLKDRIDCVVDAEFGEDYAGRADGLTHCIIITVKSKPDIDAYLNHPEHIPVAKALKADLVRLMVMDVEFFGG